MRVHLSEALRQRRGAAPLAATTLAATTLAVLALAAVGLSTANAGAHSAESNLTMHYGSGVALGNGRARTYLVLDRKTGNPVEVGVALDEQALEALPATGSRGGVGGHEHYDSHILNLPAGNGTPYQFVERDWNPKGHGGPYTAPHFDFHFYRIPLAERDAIDAADSGYAARAANLPTAEEIPAGYVSSHLLMKLTPAQATVPQMGLHWIDMASPELPPHNKPFTATFIVGSWDGKVIFDEPMITRAFIMSRRDPATADSIIPVPASKRYSPDGFYMNGYRVGYDAQAREYRIALTGLGWRS